MRDEIKMESQDARQKKWGDKTQDKKNGAMRHEAKKMGRRDRRWKKNGETRREMKKKMVGQDA